MQIIYMMNTLDYMPLRQSMDVIYLAILHNTSYLPSFSKGVLTEYSQVMSRHH